MNKPTIEELEAQVKQLAMQLELSVAAERAWETTMIRVCGEDGPLSVAGKFNQLAAENAALKMYITDECYVENKRTGLYACAGKDIPQVSTTDVILASLRAEGVEMFALMYAEEAIKDGSDNTDWKSRASAAASEYAAQLRNGGEK